MPGATITLTSDLIPAQVATSGSNGGFRFVNLPPGTYSLRFTLQGFSEIEQQDVPVTVGGSVELGILMKPSPSETVTVVGEPPLIDTRKTGITSTITAESMATVPNGRDPWFILGLTPGVDSGRLDTMSGSNRQPMFFSRGGNFANNVWNYDGVSHTSAYGGSSPTYYDFEAFSEISISTAGNDPSIQTGGVAINLVSKRAGNRWSANGSFFFANDSMQSTNTPAELLANPPVNPDTGLPSKGSNRIKDVNEYGFDAGGPILKDKLFVWGAYRHSKIEGFDISDAVQATRFNDYNLKVNFNWDKENESQAAFFKGLKNAHRFDAPASQMAPEAAWDQSSTPGQGIWTASHTWIPNDHTLVTARYGYIGSGFRLNPVGGSDVPMIYLVSIPHYENTYAVFKGEQPAHDVNADVDYYKEHLMGGDHEFRFGFEYKHTRIHTFYSYGNGVYIYDTSQTVPQGPLISGYLYAYHARDYRIHVQRTSVYGTDTYRHDRLTLNLGVRFDYQTGTNQPVSVAAVPGYESFVGPYSYPGGDPGFHFANLSPRLGAVFDLTGKGKTIVRGNFARYYDSLDPNFFAFTNPNFSLNGVMFSYRNRNNDRVITPDELGDPTYLGGWNPAGFDLNTYLQDHTVDPNFSTGWDNEFVAGVEHQVTTDLSIAANYIYRKYGNLTAIPEGLPLGVGTSDYVPGGIFHASTVLGDFSVPYFILPSTPEERILTNIHDYTQTYNGVDLTVNKRMSRHFQLNGSVTIQRQKGHYNGGDSLAFVTGSTAPFDPTNLPFLQGKAYAYQNTSGAVVYPYSEWAVKLSGVYQLPWGITAGAYLRYQQGYPYVIFGTERNPGNPPQSHWILVEPIGSRRHDNVFSLDLHVEKQFHAGGSGAISVIADIFNITNANTVLKRGPLINFGPDFNPDFNQIQQVLAPRALRLGLRAGF